MSVSNDFLAYVIDQLGGRGYSSRRMFGGVGLYSGELFFALIADDTLYFKVDDSNRGDFVARQLARTEVVTCAAPNYLDRCGRPNHPSELIEHQALVPVLPNVPREWLFHSGGESAVVQPQAALSTHHIDTLYAAALAGLGIVGLPSFMVEDALLEGALERVLPHWSLMDYRIYAAMPTRKHLPARTRVFIDFLVEVFGGQDSDPWLAAAGCETTPVRAAA